MADTSTISIVIPAMICFLQVKIMSTAGRLLVLERVFTAVIARAHPRQYRYKLHLLLLPPSFMAPRDLNRSFGYTRSVNLKNNIDASLVMILMFGAPTYNIVAYVRLYSKYEFSTLLVLSSIAATLLTIIYFLVIGYYISDATPIDRDIGHDGEDVAA